MRTIWKHKIDRSSVVTLPWPFTILSVHEQDGTVCLWAEVDPDNPVMVSRMIEVYGTGWDIPRHPEQKRFIGTAHVGPFVWHVFERGEGSTGRP